MSNEWKSFAEGHWPSIKKCTGGMDPEAEVTVHVLVTNALHARNANGAMSHVWWASPIKSDDGEVVAFTDADRKIRGLTHFLEVGECSFPDNPYPWEITRVDDQEVEDALGDAVSNGDGRLYARYLHLALKQRGLKIVRE